MALTKEQTETVLDLDTIRRGDCVRLKKAGDATFKNGFVTEAREDALTVLYSNTQNNTTSNLIISAEEIAAGGWELYWTTDFESIQHQGAAGGDAQC